MPNGWSLDLSGMAATDPSGAAGISDRTDNHLGRLGGAIALSAVLSVIANEAESDNEAGFTSSLGDARQEAAAPAGASSTANSPSALPCVCVPARQSEFCLRSV